MEAILKPIRALSDESRMRILWMLEERYLCVCEIQEGLGLSQSTVSRHMQVLEETGFVVSERDGPWKNYRLNPMPPPHVQALLSVVRTEAQSQEEARVLRERMRGIRRENLCCRPAA